MQAKVGTSFQAGAPQRGIFTLSPALTLKHGSSFLENLKPNHCHHVSGQAVASLLSVENAVRGLSAGLSKGGNRHSDIRGC